MLCCSQTVTASCGVLTYNNSSTTRLHSNTIFNTLKIFCCCCFCSTLNIDIIMNNNCATENLYERILCFVVSIIVVVDFRDFLRARPLKERKKINKIKISFIQHLSKSSCLYVLMPWAETTIKKRCKHKSFQDNNRLLN